MLLLEYFMTSSKQIVQQWGSGTWYPLDGAPGDETEHIIAQASVTTRSFAFK